MRPDADDPRGDARLLHDGEREHRVGAVGVVVLTLVLERFAAPEGLQEFESLVEELGAHLAAGVVFEEPEALFDLGRHAEPCREDDATVRQPVDRHRLPGELPRAPARHGREHGAEPDAVGDHRRGREGRPRIGRPDALPHEEAPHPDASASDASSTARFGSVPVKMNPCFMRSTLRSASDTAAPTRSSVPMS